MPAVIPFAVALAANMAGWSALATFVAMTAASVVAGVLQQSMVKKPSSTNNTVESNGYKVPTRSTQQVHRVIYGRYLVACNEVFLESTGEDNKNLWSVQNICEGPIEGVVEVDSVKQVFLDDILYTEFGGNASVWVKNGTASQTVETNLNTAVPKWTDVKKYCAYLVMKFVFDRDYYNSKPNVTLLVDGRLLYDFRTDTTAFSHNIVLAAYDWFTNTRYGLGISSALIDIPSWTSAANYCDTKGWEINMLLADRSNSYDVFEDILRHFRGSVVWSEGKYKLYYADLNYESVAMNITDESIVQNQDGTAMVSLSQPSQYGKADGLLVKFVDANKNYSLDDIPVGDSTGVVNDLSLLGSTSKIHVQEIATYLLERQILDRNITGCLRDNCVVLEPHDIVNFTTSAFSLSEVLLRVQSKSRNPDGTVSLAFIYEDEDLYNRSFDIDEEEIYSCTIPDPKARPPAVTNIDITEDNYNFRLRTFTRLNITYDFSTTYPWLDRIQVWVSIDAGVTYTHQFDITDGSGGFSIDPVEEGQRYYIKLISVSMAGRRSVDSPIASHLVTGRSSEAPDSLNTLDAIIGESSTVRVYSYTVDDSDVDIYEFRLGPAWSSGIFLASLKAPNLNLTSVKPGAHTIFANTKGTNHQYGATPRSAYATLPDPPDGGWAVSNTETDDYTSGTFDNTEQVTYSGEYYLKCSHTGDVLTGTYLTPIFDVSTSGRFLAYIIANVAVTGEGSTWNDQFPTGSTWNDIAAGKRWREIFELVAAPSVKMALLYGTTSPPTSRVDRMEILSAVVEGRYFQIEIEITDPSLQINALVENLSLKLCQ